MRRLLIAFALALSAVAQVVPVHIFDQNVPYAFGAPATVSNCSGNITGQSSTAVAINQSVVLPTTQPFTIVKGILDFWALPSLGGFSYSLQGTCRNGTQNWPIPQMTLVIPQPNPNILTITGATAPAAYGPTWSTTLTVSGSLSPWTAGVNGYLTSVANPAWQGGYLVISSGGSTITLAAATTPPANGNPTPLIPMPTAAWSGTGSLQNAGPLTFNQISPTTTPTPNQQFTLSQLNLSGCTPGQTIAVGAQSWACAGAATNPLTTVGAMIYGSGIPVAETQLAPGTAGQLLSMTGTPLIPAWVNPPSTAPTGPAGGDLSRTYPDPSVVALQGYPVANTAPTAGYALGWVGSLWTPEQVLLPANNLSDVADPSSALGNIGGAAAGFCSTSGTYMTGATSGAPICNFVPFSVLTGTASYAQTGATSLDTPNTPVGRDSAGNFAAGTITAALNGNANTAVQFLNSPANCSNSPFQAPTGINTFGVAQNCTAIPTSIVGSSTVSVSNPTGTVTLSLPSGLTLAGTTTGTFSGPLTGNVTGNVSGSAATFTGNLSGDVHGGQSSTSVLAVHGTTFPASSASDQVYQTTATGTGTVEAVPYCPDAGLHLNYVDVAHGGPTWACGNTGGTAASVSWSGVTGGTNANALLESGSLAPTGGGTISANLVNGATVPGPYLAVGTNSSGQLIAGSFQGTDAKLLTAGTVSGSAGVSFCTDSAGGATTSGCASGMVYPGSGIPNSTGSAWGSSYTTSGSGSVVALANSPTFTTPNLGTPSALILTSATGTPASIGLANGTGLPFSTGLTGTASLGQLPNSGALSVLAGTGLTGGGSVALGASTTLNIAVPVTAALGGTGVVNTATLTLGTASQNWATLPTGIVKNTTTTGAISKAADCTDYVSPGALDGTGCGPLPASLTTLVTTGAINAGGNITANANGVGVAAANYGSGGTFSGTGTCTITISGGATFTITITSSTAPTVGTALTPGTYPNGANYTSLPSSGSGSGTCSGTITFQSGSVRLNPSLLTMQDGLQNIGGIGMPISGVAGVLDIPTTAPGGAGYLLSYTGSYTGPDGNVHRATAWTTGVSSIAGDGTVFLSTPQTGAATLALANAPANTIFANNTDTAATPAYTNAPIVSTISATSGIVGGEGPTGACAGGGCLALTMDSTACVPTAGVVCIRGDLINDVAEVSINGNAEQFLPTLNGTLTAGGLSYNDATTQNFIDSSPDFTISTHTLAGGASAILNLGSAAHTTPTIVVATVGSLPASCTVGEQAFVTGATAGQADYQCSATNTWTQQSGGGSCPTCVTSAASLASGAVLIGGGSQAAIATLANLSLAGATLSIGSTGVGGVAKFYGATSGSLGISASATGGALLLGSSAITAGSAGTFTATLYQGGDAAPVATSCGTGPSVAASSSTSGGTVTEGSIATGCVVTFANAPSRCTVTSESGLVFSYALSGAALTITNVGALSSTKIDWACTK